MKLTEAEIKERVAAAQERRKKLVDLRLAVLEGHLIMEEALNGFLETSMFNPGEVKLDRTNFHVKGSFAVSLAASRGKDELWAAFWAINQLRNKIAHNIDSEEIDEKMEYLRKVYIAALEPKPAACVPVSSGNWLPRLRRVGASSTSIGKGHSVLVSLPDVRTPRIGNRVRPRTIGRGAKRRVR